MANRRRLTIEVGDTYEGGKAFKRAEGDADKMATGLQAAGKKAGKAFSNGLESTTKTVGSTMEGLGSTASDLFSSGFDVDSLGDVISGGLEGVGGKIGPVAAGIGLAAGAAFTAGLLNGFETEQAEDRLAAQLGGSEWARGMGEVAGNLYVDGFGESVADTAGAVRMVVQNHLLPEDAGRRQIEALTERFLTFTDILEQDMDMATQAVSSMLRSGIARDGVEALDIMTRAVQEGADKAGDLAETFQEYSISFREAGLSAADAAGLMVQGLSAGARDADKVADAIKEFGIRAQDGSEASAAGFDLIGLSAEEMTAKVAAGGPAAREALDQVLDGLRGMEDPVARNAAAVALFGTQAEDLGDALFALDLDGAAARLGDTAGATDDLGGAYDNAGSKVESFKRGALETLTEFIGGEVIPKLEDVRDKLEPLGEWFDEHPNAAGLIADLGAIAAIAGTVALIASKLGFLLPVIKGIGLAIGAVMQLAGTTIMTLLMPINFVLAAVALLGLGIFKLGQMFWNTFGGVIMGALSAVWGWISTHWPLLFAVLTGPFKAAQIAIALAWNTIRDRGGAALQWIKDRATDAKDWLVARFNDVVGFVAGLPGRIAGAASGMWDGIKDAFRSAINAIIGWWNNLSFPRFSHTFDPLGSFGPSMTVDIGGWDLPNIGRLHTGGVVPGHPGQEVLAILEAGETVHPAPSAGAMAAAGGAGAVEITINLEGGDAQFLEWLRNQVRVKGRGDVQVALGPRR